MEHLVSSIGFGKVSTGLPSASTTTKYLAVLALGIGCLISIGCQTS